MSVSTQAWRIGSTHSGVGVCAERLTGSAIGSYVWSRRANYFWCSTGVFVESASCEDTSKCLLRHFEVGLAPSRADSSFCTSLLSDLIFFHRPTSFPPRAGTCGPQMWPAFGPGHMSGLQYPLVLWQAGKCLCPILVRRLWWQQKPIWHWGGVPKNLSDPHFSRYTLMIQINDLMIVFAIISRRLLFILGV